MQLITSWGYDNLDHVREIWDDNDNAWKYHMDIIKNGQYAPMNIIPCSEICHNARDGV